VIMLGIRGLDPLGLVHALLGVAALILGIAQLLRRKGTPLHRRVGQAYVLSMALLNATALMIYDLDGRFGPFHVASLVSLATVAAGFVPVYLRRPRDAWMHLHAYFMCWSYVGLLAAFVSEVAVRVPGVGFGAAVFVATAVVMASGAVLIHTRVPSILGALTAGGRTGSALNGTVGHER
jgi:uncharacterized membrane protein